MSSDSVNTIDMAASWRLPFPSSLWLGATSALLTLVSVAAVIVVGAGEVPYSIAGDPIVLSLFLAPLFAVMGLARSAIARLRGEVTRGNLGGAILSAAALALWCMVICGLD